MDSTSNSHDQAVTMGTCQVTGKQVPADQLVEFQGYLVSAEGKAILLDQLRSGESVGVGDVLADPGWRTTRNGLSTIYVSVNILIVAVIVMVVIAILAVATGDSDGLALLRLMILPGLVTIGAMIAMVVGQFMCAAIPAESGAKGLAVGMAVCLGAGVVLGIASGSVGAGDQPNMALSTLANLVQLAAGVLFLLFIRKTSMYLDQARLADSAMKLLVFTIVLFVLAVVVGFMAAVGGMSEGLEQAGALAGGLGMVMVVGAVVMLIWWLRLIRGLRNAITERL